MIPIGGLTKKKEEEGRTDLYDVVVTMCSVKELVHSENTLDSIRSKQIGKKFVLLFPK